MSTKSQKAIYMGIAASGLAMVLYAVYHAYHSPMESSTDRLLVWIGAPLFLSSAYFLITGRRDTDHGEG